MQKLIILQFSVAIDIEDLHHFVPSHITHHDAQVLERLTKQKRESVEAAGAIAGIHRFEFFGIQGSAAVFVHFLELTVSKSAAHS